MKVYYVCGCTLTIEKPVERANWLTENEARGSRFEGNVPERCPRHPDARRIRG